MSLVSVEDYEKLALKKLNKKAAGYYKSGAGDEYSLRLNIESFQKLRILPRIMVDVSKRDMSTEIFGIKLSMPIAIAPTAMQKMAHPEGEVASARAAATAGTIFSLSTIATSSLEEVAQGAPSAFKWFQFYIYKNRKLSEKMVKRAEQAGFKAILLTVDAPIFGIRRSDVRNKFALPSHLKLGNFQDAVESKGGSGINEYVNSQFDPSLTWNDVKWLKSITSLPIVVKGILTPEDAVLAVKHGVDGIVVSNHGARQIDTTPSTIEVLPRIVDAVGDQIVVMMDGGIRQGTDVFKALALGAKLVFVGRPVIYGLAVDGQNGVEGVLKVLTHELDTVMALTGCPTLKDIKKEMVVHEKTFCKL